MPKIPGAPWGANRGLAFDAERIDELESLDLDGDGRSDLVVVGELDDEWIVQLLVLRPVE